MGKTDETDHTVKVPLDKWVRDIAEHAGRKAAQCVLAEHQKHVDRLCRRVRTVEIVLAVLCGSGILGGGGVLLAKMLAN